MARYPTPDNYDILSSGDIERDRAAKARFVENEKRIIEGICPNGCGPLFITSANAQDCPACGFHHWSNKPRPRVSSAPEPTPDAE